MTGKNSKSLMTWAIIALIAMIGLNGYLWYNNSQLNTTNIRKEREYVELQKVQSDLDQAYQESLESLEDMRSDNRDLNDLIESQKRELLSQKDKINNLIWTKRELSKAKEEIQNLHNQAAQYVAEISRLKQENTQLSARNTKLRGENTVLSQQIVAEIEAKKEIEVEKNNVIEQKKILSKENEKLSNKVVIANTVKVKYVDAEGYRLYDNGKRRKRRRAKNVNAFEICFKTEANLITPLGEKRFYIRVVNPTGETMTLDDGTSGVLELAQDGSQVRYTTSGTMEYNREEKNGCVTWKTPGVPQKGEYEVTVYNNGYEVGKNTLVLK